MIAHRVSVIFLCFLSLFAVQYAAHFPSNDNAITMAKTKSANDFSDEQFFLAISNNAFENRRNVERKDILIKERSRQSREQNIVEPMTFIDSLGSKKHLMVVSDDKETSKAIEFHFIKRGLENQERCIYLTHGEIENIENDMVNYGINLKHFEKENLLHVYKIQNPIENSTSILDGVNNIVNEVLKNSQLRLRIVGRMIPDVGMEEAISIQLFLERNFHAKFDTLNCSVMCTYDFDQIQANDRWQYWLDSLEKCHHVLITSRNGKSTVRYSH